MGYIFGGHYLLEGKLEGKKDIRKRRGEVDLDHLTEKMIQYINNKIKKQKGKNI